MFERYAIYFTAQGDFACAGAAWLGWDVEKGAHVPHPNISDLDIATLTNTPRKYGFHGTLKAPFRLAEGRDEATLHTAVVACARRLRPACCAGLEVAALGRFIALVPTGNSTAINDLAADTMRALDDFRAPMNAKEMARRRQSTLTPTQEANLHQWGYPHVMDQFRFHMTLTARMPKREVSRVQSLISAHFDPVLPKPFCLDALTLAGQRTNGMFETIERFDLT